MVNFIKTLTSTIAICVALLTVTTANAQHYYGREKNMRLGLTVNPNIGWLNYGEDNYDASPKMGFSYGLIADLGFARNYYFSTGLLINSINAKVSPGLHAIDQNDPAIPKSKDIYLQYVDVPLTIKLKSNENEFGRFYGQFGLTAGVKVSAKEKLEGFKKQAMSGEDLFRLGLQFGGGTEIRLGESMSFLAGLTYNNGFTRTMKEGKPKSSYLALNIGLLF